MSGVSLRDAPHVLAEALERGQALLRAEARLVKAEAEQAVARLGIGLTWYAGAALVALVALNALAAAAVLTLIGAGLSPAVAALIVAGVAVIAAALCAAVARRKLQAAREGTRHAARRLQSDARSLAEVGHA